MRISLLPFLLLAVPIAEITAFIVIGGQIGILATLGLIVLTAILGSILLRWQGFAVLRKIQAETDRGRIPGRDIGNGVMILAAGILLLTPGFVTDSLGFLLFIPAVRDAVWNVLASRVAVHIRTASNSGSGKDRDNVIDLDAEDFSETPNPHSPWRSNR